MVMNGFEEAHNRGAEADGVPGIFGGEPNRWTLSVPIRLVLVR